MKKAKMFWSKYPCTSTLRTTLSAALTLALFGCGTPLTAPIVAACQAAPVADSSLLTKPAMIKTMVLPAPPAAASDADSTAVQLSDVAEEHSREATYTQTLEVRLLGWQDWYAKMQASWAK